MRKLATTVAEAEAERNYDVPVPNAMREEVPGCSAHAVLYEGTDYRLLQY